ncbi:hypothetical protein C8F04DRAFT_1399146 [Mycena alexandri]|uniref:F-box domain-containing protein n=1 Tax=Mycena alexandri TaxID=1745969 RepID=A0AAD6SI97_9AGAR|nr:hypothetical protein C8F04DRAFT_1399146 [Mycena alexandri]
MASTSSPTLPPELEREIFELCAHSWPMEIPELMRVAHRVNQWVHALLYRTMVVLDASESVHTPGPSLTTEQALATIRAKPPAFFSTAVRHLFSSAHLGLRKDVESILAACSGLENLCLLYMDTTWIPFIAVMPLKHFYGPCKSLLTLHLSHAVFLRLTHLEVLDTIEATDTWTVHVESLPALTHLAFINLNDTALCIRLLKACKSLRVLILHHGVGAGGRDRDHPHEAALAQDGRVVGLNCSNYIQDWCLGARWGEDYWHRAEIFVEKRRAGEIDRAYPFSDFTSD